jgi:hypothetical protein
MSRHKSTKKASTSWSETCSWMCNRCPSGSLQRTSGIGDHNCVHTRLKVERDWIDYLGRPFHRIGIFGFPQSYASFWGVRRLCGMLEGRYANLWPQLITLGAGPRVVSSIAALSRPSPSLTFSRTPNTCRLSRANHFRQSSIQLLWSPQPIHKASHRSDSLLNNPPFSIISLFKIDLLIRKASYIGAFSQSYPCNYANPCFEIKRMEVLRPY